MLSHTIRDYHKLDKLLQPLLNMFFYLSYNCQLQKFGHLGISACKFLIYLRTKHFLHL